MRQHLWQPRLLIALTAALASLLQAYEYIFPLGRGWAYDYGAGLETIPLHVALINQHALGASLAPFVAGGVDRLSFFGNADSPMLLNSWLFIFFSPQVANGIHMVLQSFIGSTFAGLLCYDRLKLGLLISAVAAIVYTSFSYPVFGFLFNASLIPFFAWLLTGPKTHSFVVLIFIGLIASFLTSLGQGFPFIALFIAIWMPVVARAPLLRTAKSLSAITIGYGIGKLPTLLAILHTVGQSQRSGELRYDSLIDTPILYTESDFLYSDRHMWTYTQVFPAFFAAICGVFLLWAIANGLRQTSDANESGSNTPNFATIACLGIVYIILASGILVPLRSLLVPLFPWLGSVNMVRSITASGALLNTLVVVNGLAIVGWGIKRKELGWIIAAVIVAICFCALVRHPRTVVEEYVLLTLILSVGITIQAFWNRVQFAKRSGVEGGTLDWTGALVVVPALVLAGFYACVAPKILLGPARDAPQTGFARYHIPAIPEIESGDRTLHRYASVLPLQPANALVSGVEPLDGWANLYSSKFREFWLTILAPLFEARPVERNIFGTAEHPPQDHYIFLGSGAFLPSDPPGGIDVDRRFEMNLLSLMNVGYLLSLYPLSSKYLVEVHAPDHPLKVTDWDYATGRSVNLDRFDRGWPNVLRGLVTAVKGPRSSEDQVYAYHNVCALPRVFSVANLERHDSDRDVLQSLSTANPAELMRTAHVLDADAPRVGMHLSAASVKLLAYRGDEVDFEAAGSGEAVIVLANAWIPGWKAYVDGKEVPVFRVNHTQIGIHLPVAGTFQIRIAYEPTYLWLSKIFSAPARLVLGSAEARPSGHDRDLGIREMPAVCGSSAKAP